jgi:hypothetical protein
MIVRDGAHVLAFDPVLEHLDFKRVPGFFDDRIIEAINEGLASQRRKLAWNLTRTMSLHRPMPARVVPAGQFDLAPTSATVTVAASELRIEATFEAHVTRAPEDVARLNEQLNAANGPPSSRRGPPPSSARSV